MDYILADTNIWLDIATDRDGAVVIAALEEAVKTHVVKIVVPDIVRDEFERHEGDIVEKTLRQLGTFIKNAKQAADVLCADEHRKDFDRLIQTFQTELLSKKAEGIHRIERVKGLLLNNALETLTNDSMKVSAAERGVSKRAPFHRNKNATADAVILEHFRALTIAADGRKFFVSRNAEEFSALDQNNNPHPDIADFFDERSSLYARNIAEVANLVKEHAVSDAVVQHFGNAADIIEHLVREDWKNLEDCPIGGKHDFDDSIGMWMRSRYGGGLTWNLICRKCRIKFDTGEFSD